MLSKKRKFQREAKNKLFSFYILLMIKSNMPLDNITFCDFETIQLKSQNIILNFNLKASENKGFICKEGKIEEQKDVYDL